MRKKVALFVKYKNPSRMAVGTSDIPGAVRYQPTHMEIIVHQVDGLQIGQSREDGYINLTKMAQASNKRINNYLRLPATKEFLKEVSTETRISASGQNGLIQVRRGGDNIALQGTWGHPYVAVNFGQWCNPKFALLVSKWVFCWMQEGIASSNHLDAGTLSSASKVVKAYVESSRSLNRTIHNPIHQQTDSLRDALKPLQSFGLDLHSHHLAQAEESIIIEEAAPQKSRNRKGCLYRYLERKKNKDGDVVLYPRIEGDRSPLNPEHWRWGFNWEEKIDGQWKNRSLGCVPVGAIPMIKFMQEMNFSVEEMVDLIRRAKAHR